MLKLVFFLLGVILCMAQSVNAQSQFDRYTGVLSQSEIEQDQLVKLDFIVDRQSSQEFKLIAVLSLYFGDFESNEYVTYHFDNVVYNVLTGTLVFDQPDQDLSLIVDNFAQGRLTGQLRSSVAGAVGRIELAQNTKANPSRPLVQPLWGEYRGSCDDIGTVLQIQTSRTSGDSTRMGNPFGTFETTAQLAEVTPTGCGGNPTLCVMRTYDTGSYNFFSGQLDLIGRSRNLNCTVKTDGLDCNSCILKRTSGEGVSAGPKDFRIFNGGFSQTPSAGRSEPATSATDTQLSGEYKGYLFHEKLGIYQAVSLDLATYQAPGSQGGQALFVSAASVAYFGDHESNEFVSQRFNQKEFPLLSPQIVLERLDGDVDTVIQITQLGNGKARGVWYSILFGRVGTFELNKTGLPVIPTDAVVMGPLSGFYDGQDNWKLELRVIRDSTPVNTVNPFYPLNFKGAFRLHQITPNIRIDSGSFDFYTGKISMTLEGGSLFTGYRNGQDSFALKRPTPGIIRPLSSHKFMNFKRSTQ